MGTLTPLWSHQIVVNLNAGILTALHKKFIPLESYVDSGAVDSFSALIWSFFHPYLENSEQCNIFVELYSISKDYSLPFNHSQARGSGQGVENSLGNRNGFSAKTLRTERLKARKVKEKVKGS